MNWLIEKLGPTALKYATPAIRHLIAGGVIALTTWLLTTFDVMLSAAQQEGLTTTALAVFLGIIKWAATDHSHAIVGKQVEAIAVATDTPKAEVIAMAAQAASGNPVAQADAAAPTTKAELLETLP